MNTNLPELNAQYRCEYEEATKRLQNTLKILTSLLVAITGIIAAAVAAYIPACTCQNYEVNDYETAIFILNVICSILAFIVNVMGIMPNTREEGLFMLKGQVLAKNLSGKGDNYDGGDYGENIDGSEQLDLREFYRKKTETANKINRRKQIILLSVAILLIFAIISLIFLIVFGVKKFV